MKAENDSFGSCLVVSKSLLITSTSVVLVLVVEFPKYVLPISSSSIFHVKEPFEGGSGRSILEHLV